LGWRTWLSSLIEANQITPRVRALPREPQPLFRP
jgi:hypothetical protein